jgi:DNA polymerase I-like protein with 3'-5' exonuclease and polymerase domains
VTKVEAGKYDADWFLMHGIDFAGPVEDPQVMAWVLNENTPLDLDWLSWRYAELDMDKRLRRSGGVVYFETADGRRIPLANFRDMDRMGREWQELEAYNARDVEGLRELHGTLLERLHETDWREYYDREQLPYTGVLLRMETRGLPINLEEVAALTAELEPLAEEQRAKLLADSGLPSSFNLNSQKQLGAYLFSRVLMFPDRIGPKEVVEAYKSCVAGEHEDCEPCGDEDLPCGGDGECLYHKFDDEGHHWSGHIVDLLPSNFTVESVGRDYLIGYWSVPGRGHNETPHTVNKVTGEESKYPSVASPDLLYYLGTDPWVHELCTGYRKTNKLLTTYLRVFPKIARPACLDCAYNPGLCDTHGETYTPDYRIFATFKQTGTVTGRLSSAGPNLQNQPARGELGKKMRHLYQGRFVIGDYDQLEMRLMAHFSEDRNMVRVFERGDDPHYVTAQGIFGETPTKDQRDIGKTLNYGMGYGAGPKKIAQTLSLLGYPTSPDTAKGYLAEMTRFYSGFFRWKTRTVEMAKRKGSVRTLGGHRRRLRAAFKDTANWKLVGYGERQAVNAIVQGTAADIIRRTMIRADEAFPELKMLAQVHDEVIWEHPGLWLFDADPKMLPELRDCMQGGHDFALRVPLVFEPAVVETWADKGGTSLVELFEEDDEEEYDE